MSSGLNALFAALVLLVLVGCNAVKPNQMATVQAQMPSFTDPASRQLALESLSMLPQRFEDYRVGPGDVLEISIFEWELRGETKTARYVVSESGTITIPVLDDIKVGALNLSTIKRLLETRLKDGGLILQPRVSVDIAEYRSKRVSVIGAVGEPGMYTLRQNVTTLLDLLSLAGGTTEAAGYILQVLRPVPGKAAPEGQSPAGGTAAPRSEMQTITLDLLDLLERGNMSLNMVIQHGDTIFVPQAKTFSIIGYVNTPGNYVLNRPTTVLDAVAHANGLLLEEASPEECYLRRRTEVGDETIAIDLIAIANGQKENYYLMPMDIIDIRQNPGKKMAKETLRTLTSLISIGFRAN